MSCLSPHRDPRHRCVAPWSIHILQGVMKEPVPRPLSRYFHGLGPCPSFTADASAFPSHRPKSCCGDTSVLMSRASAEAFKKISWVPYESQSYSGLVALTGMRNRTRSRFIPLRA